VDPVEVEDCDAAELAHRDRKLDIDDAVHRGAPDRDRKLDALPTIERAVDLVVVESYTTGHELHFVETIRAACVPSYSYLEARLANLEARLLPGNHSAGCEPTLIQGVLTPMAAGFSKL